MSLEGIQMNMSRHLPDKKALGIFYVDEIFTDDTPRIYGIAFKEVLINRVDSYVGFYVGLFRNYWIPFLLSGRTRISSVDQSYLTEKEFRVSDKNWLSWEESLTSPVRDVRETAAFLFQHDLILDPDLIEKKW